MTDRGFKSKRHRSNQTFGAKLRDAIETYEENWATPQSRDYKGARRKLSKDGKNRSQTTGETFGKDLNQQVKNWPTATVFDTTGGSYPTQMVNGVYRSKHSQKPNSPWYGAKLKDAVETHDGRLDQVYPNTNGKSRESQGKLNPNWVEHLMGLPVGWTQLPTAWIDSGCSATAL
tara:strand:- start:318 stop:839 length:522 start_codon:yes stop_codon:yes gene_type:complete